MLTRQLCHQKGRDLRRVGKRFIVEHWQARDDVDRLLCGHIEFGMVAPQVACHGGSMVGFVVLSFMKADAKRLDRSAGERLQRRHHGARVHPAREERPEWHIRLHLAGNGLTQQRIERLRGVGVAACKGVRTPVLDRVMYRPVGLWRWVVARLRLFFADGQPRTWGQLMNTSIDRVWRWHVTQAHE